MTGRPTVVAVPGSRTLRDGSRFPGAGWRHTPRGRVPFLLALVLLAFGLRVGAAVALDQRLYATGCGGFLSEDEEAYDRVAWAQARAWRGVGHSVRSGDAYLLNPYTYAEAAVYVTVGHRPLAMKLLNCLFGALAAGLVFLTARQLFGHVAARISGLAAAFFPTTFLFSIVNLKDAMFLCAVALLLWLLTVSLVSGRPWLLAPAVCALLLVGALRVYMQGFLALLVPGSVMLQRAARFPHKWLTSTVLISGCVAILWFGGGAQWVVAYVPFLDQQRFASAQGAMSGYAALSSAANARVGAGGSLTTSGGHLSDQRSNSTSIAPPSRGLACLLGPAVATSPGNQPPDRLVESTSMLSLPHGGASGFEVLSVAPPGAQLEVQTANPSTATTAPWISTSLRSLAAWLPQGLAFAIAAPFPWAAQRTVERLTVPEMLLWYALLALAGLGAAMNRDRWRSYAHLVVYIGGMFLIFAIGQGNLGTLVRQRSMMVAPFVFVFSGAGAMWFWEIWRSRGRAESAGEEEAPTIVQRGIR